MAFSLKEALEVLKRVLGSQFERHYFTAESMALRWHQHPVTVSRKLAYNHPDYVNRETRKPQPTDITKFIGYFDLAKYDIDSSVFEQGDINEFESKLIEKRAGIYGDPQWLRLADLIVVQARRRSKLKLKLSRIDNGIFRGIQWKDKMEGLPEITLYPQSTLSIGVEGAKGKYLILLDYVLGEKFTLLKPMASDKLMPIPSDRQCFENLIECGGPYDKKISLIAIATTKEVCEEFHDSIKDQACQHHGSDWWNQYETLDGSSELDDQTCRTLRRLLESEARSETGSGMTNVAELAYYVSSLRPDHAK